VPFGHGNRAEYARVFERFGSHYVKRAWVGGKASLVFIVRKSSSMTKSEIMAGLKASLPGIGVGNLSAEDQRTREKLQSNSQCTVLGQGGTEVQLAALGSLDDAAHNAWLETVRLNPEVIELEVEGIWTLVKDPAVSRALMEAYQEETVFSPFRVVFTTDHTLHLFRDVLYSSYDLNTGVAGKPQRIRERWPQLFDVGFERVDAAFLGRYLVSSEGEDLGSDDDMLREAYLALAATLRNFGHLGNDTLCHGQSGNAELFLRFATLKREPAFQLEANVQAQAQWRRLALAPGWPEADGTHRTLPGLMIGIAGMGMHFLRLAHPDRVPSPLMLDLPPGLRPGPLLDPPRGAPLDPPLGAPLQDRRQATIEERRTTAVG
jgi:hypothetical protein